MMYGKLLFIAVTLTLVWGGQGVPHTRQLSCDSQLRIILPHLFTHCSDCSYSEWSEWQFVRDSIVDVPTYQCSSGQSYTESRTRSAITAGCDTETETRVICYPEQQELLIEALGLGSTGGAPGTTTLGGQIFSASVPDSTNRTGRDAAGQSESPEQWLPRSEDNSDSDFGADLSRRQISWQSQDLCPGTGRTGPICTGYPYNRGKRSLRKEFETSKTEPIERKEPRPLPEAPIPYNRKEHGARFRRQSPTCQPNGEKYILFVLDTSGSIGSAAFNRMTTAISQLVALFCSPPKIAAMTFGSDFNLEFCFDCFSSDPIGRIFASNALRNIPYRGGLTRTGGAARCVCDKLLQPACGMHPYADCIDVVFITDGKSNDPQLEVCDEVRCLHQHLNGVNTYAIGINNYAEDEIQCIASSSNLKAVFRFEDFDEFEAAIADIITRLSRDASRQYTCARTDGSLGG